MKWGKMILFSFLGTSLFLAFSMSDARIFNNKLNAETERFPNRWWEQLSNPKSTKAREQFLHPPLIPTSTRFREKNLFPRFNKLVKDRTARVRRKTKDSAALVNALTKSPLPVVYQTKLKHLIPQIHDVLREVWKTLYPSSISIDLPLDFGIEIAHRKAKILDLAQAQNSDFENNHFNRMADRSKDAKHTSFPGNSEERLLMFLPKTDDHLKSRPGIFEENGFSNQRPSRLIGLQEHEPKLQASTLNQTDHQNKSLSEASTRDKDFKINQDLAAPLLRIYPDDVPAPLIPTNETDSNNPLEVVLFTPKHLHKEMISDDVQRAMDGGKIQNVDSGTIERGLGMIPNAGHVTQTHDEEKREQGHESQRKDAARVATNLRKSNLPEQFPPLQNKSPVSNNPFSFTIPIVPKYSKDDIDPVSTLISSSRNFLPGRMDRNKQNAASLKRNNVSQLRNSLQSKTLNATHGSLSPKTMNADEKFSSQSLTDMMGKDSRNSASIEGNNVSHLRNSLRSNKMNANDKFSSQILQDMLGKSSSNSAPPEVGMGKNGPNSESLEVNIGTGKLSQSRDSQLPKRSNANDNHSFQIVPDVADDYRPNSASLKVDLLADMVDENSRNSATLEVGNSSHLRTGTGNALQSKKNNANQKSSSKVLSDAMMNIPNSAALEENNFPQLRGPLLPKRSNVNENYSSQSLLEVADENSPISPSLKLRNPSQLRGPLSSKRNNANDKHSSQILPDVMGKYGPNSASLEAGNLSQLRNSVQPQKVNAKDKYSSQILSDVMGKNKENSASIEVNDARLRNSLQSKNMNANDKYWSQMLPDMMGKSSENSASLEMGNLSKSNSLKSKNMNANEQRSSQILPHVVDEDSPNSASLEISNLSQLHGPLSPKRNNINDNYSSQILKDAMDESNQNSASRKRNNLSRLQSNKVITNKQILPDVRGKNGQNFASLDANLSHLRNSLQTGKINADDRFRYSSQSESGMMGKNSENSKSVVNDGSDLRKTLNSKKMNANDNHWSLMPKTPLRTSLPIVTNNNRFSKNADYSDFPEDVPIPTLKNNIFGQMTSGARKSDDETKRNNFLQNLLKTQDDIDSEVMNVTKMNLKDVFEIVSKEHGYDKQNPNFMDLRDKWEKITRLSGTIHNREMPSYAEPEYDRLKAFYLLGHQNALYLSRNLDKILSDDSSKVLETPSAQNGVRYAQFFGSGSLNPVTNEWMYKNRRKNLHV